MGVQTADFRQYVRAVGSRLWLVALIVAVAVGATYWHVGRAPAAYTASATMIVNAPVLTPAPSLDDRGGAVEFRPAQGIVTNDIIYLITSRPIAARVAERLKLPGPASVQRAIEATPIRLSSLIRITATARNRELAANLANVTAEEFVAYFRETNRASMSETRRFVEDQLGLARTRLEGSERAIQSFKESRGMPSIEAQAGIAVSSVATGQAAIDAAIAVRQETEARLATARARFGRERPEVTASRSTAENPVFRQFQARLVDLEIQRTQLSQIYTPQHPRLEAVTSELADIRKRLTTETRTLIGEEVIAANPIHARLLGDIVTLEVERAAVDARVAALQGTQRRLRSAAMSIPSAETQFNRLMRENRVLESTYTSLSNRYQEILLREQLAGFYPASLQLVEAAIAPSRATPSAFPKTAAAAGLAGIVLGVMAALFLEALDDRIRGAQDAEHALGVPVLAQIPSEGHVRTAPATAIFTISMILVAALAIAGVARGYVTADAASDGFRNVTTTVTSWFNGIAR